MTVSTTTPRDTSREERSGGYTAGKSVSELKPLSQTHATTEAADDSSTGSVSHELQ
ncbi:hypothetical protein ACFVKB_46765 [Rhodococcus sp. NPDC127530]|uniref:hypothetical protein n=1 Tax=unclassified Rhodococcus (in: high G+C Gram-positive bacteria) TaxID=192944 RepID=UPI00363C9566